MKLISFGTDLISIKHDLVSSKRYDNELTVIDHFCSLIIDHVHMILDAQEFDIFMLAKGSNLPRIVT